MLAVPAFLAGCGGGGPASLPTGTISAYFPAAEVDRTIEVVTIDRLVLRRAELVAPDGGVTAALSIAARPAPSDTTALVLPSGAYAGGTAELGAVAGNPPTAGVVGAAVQTQTRLLATVSRATIVLPDPVAYRNAWSKYRIRLRFGDPPEVKSSEIAAPEPPPPAIAGPSSQS